MMGEKYTRWGKCPLCDSENYDNIGKYPNNSFFCNNCKKEWKE